MRNKENTFEAIVVPPAKKKNNPQQRGRFYWRLREDQDLCFCFCFRRSSRGVDVVHCSGCHKSGKNLYIKIIGERFLEDPEGLQHICQPFNCPPEIKDLSKKPQKRVELSPAPSPVPFPVSSREPSSSSSPEPMPADNANYQKADPIFEEIIRQELIDQERERRGLPLLVDTIEVPDFVATYRLLLEQKQEPFAASNLFN